MLCFGLYGNFMFALQIFLYLISFSDANPSADLNSFLIH